MNMKMKNFLAKASSGEELQNYSYNFFWLIENGKVAN